MSIDPTHPKCEAPGCNRYIPDNRLLYRATTCSSKCKRRKRNKTDKVQNSWYVNRSRRDGTNK